MRKKIYMSKKKIWHKIDDLASFIEMVLYRKSFLTDQLKMKKEQSKGSFINNKSINKTWRGIKIDKEWIRFYNNVQREDNRGFDARYIPLDIQYCFIDDWFNDTRSALLLDDKNMYDLYFYDVNRPRTVGRIINGLFFDENYSPTTVEKIIEKCIIIQHVILKPTVFSSAGCGIEFWNVEDGIDVLNHFLSEGKNYIIQELINQHEELSKVYNESVNSIRIVTCNYEGETNVLSAVLRVGVNGNKLDNASKGGMFCGINEDGSLKKYGYTKQGVAHTTHPQGAVFGECRIPNYDKCKELCIKLSYRFLRIAKLVSWDLAVDKDGNPVLIEVNLCYGGADIHQIANGPLYGEKTDEILNRVFRESRKYRFFNKWFSLYK